ncbi:MAG: beta strand repeat-containing protein, partial [Planctomycetaceae bacterium]
SVSSAGDVNGDGFDDLLIGAERADASGNAKNYAGESYVIFGGDFTAAVTHQGTSAAETLTGTAGANVMVGDRGNDTLVGSGGADVQFGGQGSDILAVSDLSFQRIIGGTGTDTLRLDGSGLTLNLTTLADNRILGVEQIDLTGSGDNTLTLDLQEVFNISDESNTLLVRRNAGDTVNIGTGWTQGANETIGADTFDVYTQGAATLKVQAVAVPPAGFEVGTLADEDDGQTTQDADLSLREAIRLANANADASVITFAPGLFTGGDQSISLSLFDTGLDSTEAGATAFIVSTPITINGPTGDNGLTIARDSGAANFRLFHVQAAGNLTLDSLTLMGGNAQGNSGGRTTRGGGGGGGAGLGGAVFVDGSFTAVRSTFRNNTAQGGTGGGSGADLRPEPLGGGGGAALGANGQPSPTSAPNNGGAGGGPNGGSGGVFAGAPAGSASGFSGGGGGGANGTAGGNGNFGGGGGGGLTANGGIGGFGSGGGGGGGQGGLGGASGFGAGAGANGSGSIAQGGGGGGGGGLGGAIFLNAGSVDLTNSTFTSNTATGGGGGGSNVPGAVAGSGLGGAVFARNGSLTIVNTTISSNTAVQGARGIYVLGDGGTAVANLDNTIVGQSDTSVSDFVANTINGGTTSTSGANNLIRVATGFGGTSVSMDDPNLAALADNGGPTQTFALNAGSPAIDAGTNAAATGLTFDQRGTGFDRIVNTTVDIGAFESAVIPDTTAPTLTSFTRQTPSTSTTDADSLVFRVTFDEAVQNVDAADFAVNGTTTATVTGVTSADSNAGLLYDVTVSGGDLATFNGTVGLNLSGSQNITDVASNALPGTEPLTDETYEVSNPASTISLTGGVLTLTDIVGAGNTLTLRLETTANPDEYILSDSGNIMFSSIAGTSGNGTDTLRIPVTGITSFVINLGAGNDKLTLDGSGGNPSPSGGITYDGGDGTDSIAVKSLAGATTSALGANGSGKVKKLTTTIVTFNNLEPLDLTESAITTLEIEIDPDNTVSGPITATLSNDAAAGITRIDFDNGLESVIFATPSVSLTITGDPLDGDIINVVGVDESWNVPIFINGGGGLDTVNFQTNATSTGGGDLTVTADTVHINAAVSTGGGDVSITVDAAFNVSGTGSLSSGGGNISITGLNQAQTAGQVTADGNAATSFNLDTETGFNTLAGFMVPAGTGRLLVVDFGTFVTSPATEVTAVTFDGTPLTRAVGLNDASLTLGQGELWYLPLGDGAAVTGDIVITGGESGTIIGAATFQGVDQSVSINGATSTISSPNGAGTFTTQLIVSSQVGDLVLDSLFVIGDVLTFPINDASQTLSHNQLGASDGIALASSTEAGAASVSLDWTVSGGTVFSVIHVGLNINAAAGGGTSDSTFTTAFGSSINAGAGALNLTFDSLDLATGSSLSGSGALTIKPADDAATIGIGGGVGELNLSDDELATLTDGFNLITIGSATGTGAVDIGSSTFTDNVAVIGGSIDVTALDAGANNVTLTTTDGNVILTGTTTGTGVTITSAGNINGAGLITATTIDLNAVTGIGNTTALELAATSLSADTTNGNINLDNANTAAATFTSLTTGTGTITVDNDGTGGGSASFTTVSTSDGAIDLENIAGNLTVGTSVTAGGTANVTLTTTTSGNVILTGTTTAANDTVTINSAGSINGAGLVTATTIDVNAVTGIGNTIALEL